MTERDYDDVSIPADIRKEQETQRRLADLEKRVRWLETLNHVPLAAEKGEGR